MNPVVFFGLAAGLTALGLGNLHSATSGLDGLSADRFQAQALYAVLGIGIAALLAVVRPGDLRSAARPAWMVTVVLLIAVLFGGHVAGGARSWLALGPVRLQPSELLKVVLPLAVAHEACRPWWARRWHHWAVLVSLIGVPLCLLAVQPDMGALGLLGLTSITVLWAAGLPRWMPWLAALGGAIAAPLGWSLLHPYQQARVLTFLDPTRDPSGAGYQTLQSFHAVGSGGLTGVGFGAGTQGRLGFVPEHWTDFALAHLAEEWGLVGVMVVLGGLFVLSLAGLAAAERSRDRFSALLAIGLSSMLLWQTVVNAAGVLGLLPLTGVTLPFFSYGGSSMVSTWLGIGALICVARRPARGLTAGSVAWGPNTVVPDWDTIWSR